MADPVVWNPRVDVTGDDRYRWPADACLTFGPTAGYSATPTLAEVNAGSGLNQIVAEVKRRGGGLSYFTGSKLLASQLQNLRDAINAVRNSESYPTFSGADYAFTADFNAGARWSSQSILELRQAINQNRLNIRPQTGITLGCFVRTDNPYGTLSSETIYTQPEAFSHDVGKRFEAPVTTRVFRQRAMAYLAIPAGYPSFTSAHFYTRVSQKREDLESFQFLNLYLGALPSSNTDVSKFYDFSTFGAQIASSSIVVSTSGLTLASFNKFANLPTTFFDSAAGQTSGLFFATEVEKNGSGTVPTPGGTFKESFCRMGSLGGGGWDTSALNGWLELNW